MYEIILLLEENAGDAHNPSFIYESRDSAVKMLFEMLGQGYDMGIRKISSESEKDENE